MRTRDLIHEMRAAHAALTAADRCELAQFGVSPLAVDLFQLVGIARIGRLTATECYEPDPNGTLAFITPVRIHYPDTPETPEPGCFCRFGNLVDLVAWDPRTPRQWRLRADLAPWLGCVRPQYLDPDPVRVWRSVLNWLRADCDGIVLLGGDPAVAYSLLMGFPGGIDAEDEVHAAELRRILRRPWPMPRISVGAPLARGTPGATE